MLTSLQALLRLATLRWLGVFICALATLLSAASIASALEPAQTKTRVWGFDFAERNSVGLFRAASPRTHPQNRAAGAEEASGSLLAAKAGAEAAERGIVAANGTKILGYTKHGIERAIGDAAERAGTKATSILDALKNPTSIKSGVDKLGRPFQTFEGSSARVVVNPQTGQIVSVNPIGGAGVR